MQCIREEIALVSKRGHFPGARSLHTLCFYRYCSTFFQKQITINKFWGTCVWGTENAGEI